MSENHESPRTTDIDRREQARERAAQAPSDSPASAGGLSKAEVLDAIPDPHTSSRQYTDDQRRHDDYEDICREFGVKQRALWDVYTESEARQYGHVEAGELKLEKYLVPNYTHHAWEYDDTKMLAGGTDFLAVGPPGSGKSTMALNHTVRLLEENDEKVVWRASTARSEWLPFAPWARVCLPEGVDVSARFVPKVPTQEGFDVDLEEIVREVVRYRSPTHLNQERLKEGQFHVVYPDPKMRGIQSIYEDTQEKQYDGLEFSAEDPLNHWWFGYILAQVERGPYHWTSLMFDEIGDIAPEAARNDEYAHYQKVELFKDCMVDARKTGLSIFMFGHTESDIHSMIRRKIRWRVAMSGKANPTKSSQVVGFNNVPMNENLASNQEVGWMMPYNESRFDYPGVRFANFPDPVDMTLKVSFE
ncbi:ATP-binding protein [Haloarcula montana]|uniref:ATP-binding protein n=1 Tax=Haloarcula montana TaxID=3111776 RepID=UPI002D79F6B5|nr:ATP-binding protein [Haloarcula sp. GH36]